MDKIKELLAKEFIWLIASFIFAFPIALIPMVLVQSFIKDYQDFITRIDNQVVILYLIFVIICFIGLLIMRFTSSVIKILFLSSK
jgi:cytochrome c biogenesis protein CcdA